MPVARRAASASTSASSRCGVQPAGEAGQRRRPDLDHDPARRPELRPGTHVSSSRASPKSSSSRAAPAPVDPGGQPVRRRRAGALLQPPVRPAPGQHDRDPRGRRRLPVEGDVADRDRAARHRPRLGQRLLDPEPGQPVAQVADGLVVVEVRLPDPAFGPRAAHDEPARQLAVRRDGEAGVVDRDGPQHQARRLGDRLRRPVGAHLLGHRERQLAQSLAGGGGDLEHRPAEPLGQLGAHQLGELPGVRHVDLVQRDEPGPVGQHTAERRGVAGELVLERLHVRDGVAAGRERRAVDHVHQHRAPLDVPEEVQPQATALGGARDQPRHVGDGEDLLPRGDHAQLRDERGERVVRDLRPGRRQGRDQRRLAGRGEPDQADVGDRAQLQHEVTGLARLAEQREAGRLPRGRGERGVAQPPTATRGGDEPRARPDEVGEDLAVRRHDDGAVRHGELQVVRVRAGLEPALALLPVAGRRVRAVVEVEQGVHARVDDEHDGAAAAPVAPVRAAERLELLAVHRGAPVAARTRGGVHHHPIDELGHANSPEMRTAGPPRLGRPAVRR